MHVQNERLCFYFLLKFTSCNQLSRLVGVVSAKTWWVYMQRPPLPFLKNID